MRIIKPTFGDDRLTLFRGDALKILPQLKFDHAIFDPPYEDHMHAAKRGGERQRVVRSAKALARLNSGAASRVEKDRARKIRTDGYAPLKAVNFASIQDLRRPLTEAVVGSCCGWMIAFCTPEGIAPWRDEIERAKARYKRALFWCKPDGAPQFNGQGPAFAVEAMVSAWCGRGVSRWNGGGSRNYFVMNCRPSDREGSHATEKPIELMMRLVELFTKPGDVVCDPCMGSGTTIIAALACGRKAIGIEKDAASFKLARARIKSELTMGTEEARRYVLRATGRVDKNAGPLFSGEVVR